MQARTESLLSRSEGYLISPSQIPGLARAASRLAPCNCTNAEGKAAAALSPLPAPRNPEGRQVGSPPAMPN